jgi:hypothetical protein
MKKKEIMDDTYFDWLLLYILNNPVKHNFVDNLYDWPYSSIHLYTTDAEDSQNFEDLGLQELKKFKSLIYKEVVLSRFGGVDGFIEAHKSILESIRFPKSDL